MMIQSDIIGSVSGKKLISVAVATFLLLSALTIVLPGEADCIHLEDVDGRDKMTEDTVQMDYDKKDTYPKSGISSGWLKETVDTYGDAGMGPSLAVDSSGFPHIAYWDGGANNLMYATWDGTTWQRRTVNIAVPDFPSASLAIDSSDNPHIAYTVSGELRYGWYDSNDNWQGATVLDNINYMVDHDISLGLDNEDDPHICYFTTNDEAIRYAYRDDMGSWHKLQALWGNSYFGDFSLAMDTDDLPIISFYDTQADDLVCCDGYGYTSGSLDYTTRIVDSGGRVGRYNSIAVSSEGYATISYYDETFGNLKIAEQGLDDWSCYHVDYAGDVGSSTSIILDEDDDPHVSYLNNDNSSLKYGRDDTSFGRETVDDSATFMWDTSIAIGKNGHPRIAYYDGTAGDLKYAVEGVPSKPPFFIAGGDDGEVNLWWGTSDDEGGRDVTGYNIYRGTSPGGESFLTSVSASTKTYTDTSVSNGNEYYYYVTAENPIGESDPSVEANATPSTDNRPPTKPSDPYPEDEDTLSEGQDLTTLMVDVRDPDGDSMDVTFKDNYGNVIGTDNNVASGDIASVTWNGLTDNWPYFWHAIADDGTNTTSSDFYYFLTDDPYGDNDGHLTAYDITGNETRWLTSMQGYGRQADQDWYEIEVNGGYEHVTVKANFTHSSGDIDLSLYNGSGLCVASSTSETDNETLHHKVESGGTYYIRVDGDDESNFYDLWWDDTDTPLPPKNPKPADGSPRVQASPGPELNVTVYDGSGQNMDVTFYDGSDDSVIGTVSNVPSGGNASVQWTGLDERKTYEWYAVADDTSTSVSSPTWNFTTNGVPDAPTNPYPAPGATGIELSPRLSADVSDPDGDVMDVHFINSDNSSVIGIDKGVENGSTGSFVWDDLEPGTTYNWTALAEDGVDWDRIDQSFTTDDAYEDNDARTSAYDLVNNETEWLTDINGTGVQSDEDWYEIYVNSGYERVVVNCTFDHSQGDIDLALYDSDGFSVDSSSSTSDNETIDTTVVSSGTYYIRVYFSDAGNTYDLRWDDKGTTSNSPPAEPTNPSPVDGATVPGTSQSLSVDVSDPDGDTMTVSFYDASDDSEIGNNTGVTNGTTSVTWSGLSPATTYQWYAVAQDGDLSNTSVTWSFTTDDAYEENDNLSSAYNITSNDGSWLSFIDGPGIQADDDWYQIYAFSGSERLVANCTFDHSQGDIDLRLYNETGVELATSHSTTDNESIDRTVSSEGFYYLELSYGNAGNSYDLWWDDLVVNDAPFQPSNPSPADGSTGVSLDPQLSVDVSDPDGDTLDVTFYDASDNSIIDTASGVSSGGTATGTWFGLNEGTTYEWYVIVDDGGDTTQSTTWNFTTIPTLPIGEAVDNTNLSWSTGGNASWFGQAEEYNNNSDAAESGNVSDEQTSYVQTTVSGPGNLSFYWRVSSEESWDYLKFYIDNTLQDHISGVTSWMQQTYTISSGSHTLNWSYEKDGSISQNEDRGWLDKVVFTSTTQNQAPDAPTNPSPADGSTGISTSPTLSADVSDPEGDTMDVSFYDASDDSLIGSNSNVNNGTTSVSWSGLLSGTTYQWYVVADDGTDSTQSTTWSFTTETTSTGAPWPMFHHDLNHTGRSPYNTSHVDGAEKWSFSTGGWIASSPVIGNDSTIYVGSKDDMLYAVNHDGTEKWNFSTGSDVDPAPAIGPDGTIYVGSWDSNLYAIHDSNGTEKWNFSTGFMIQSSPTVAPDGTIYVGSYDTNLYALNPNGTPKWSFSTANWVHSSPAIGSDGTIYVGSGDHRLYAIYPNGTQKWMYTTNDHISSSPSIGSDGTIYIGSYDSNLYAIYPNGTERWSFSTGGNVTSSPAIAEDGTIYVGSKDGKLYAVNPDGSERWSFTTGNEVVSSPAIGKDGTVYVGSRDDKLYAVNPDGSEKWNFSTGGRVWSSPAIGSDGRIYVGSADQNLYSIGESSTTISIGEAVDNTNLSWSTGGNASWFGQATEYNNDSDAAESGNISDEQVSYVETTVGGAGNLSFYWKVSSENIYDNLKFYIDGLFTNNISGVTSWEKESYTLSSGSHTLRWSYEKDISISENEDCGWLDKVEFSPAGSNQAPDAPTNPSPADGATGIGTSPTLSVDVSDPDGDLMEVDFYDASDDSWIGSNSYVGNGTTSISWSGLSQSTTYQWYAVANDSIDETQSNTWSFTTASSNLAPDAPTNPSPADGATGVATTVNLSVTVSDPDGDAMNVSFYYADDSWIGTHHGVSDGDTASIPLYDLDDGTTFDWYAVANDTVLETQSSTWSFTTVDVNDVPNEPTDPLPSDGASDVSTSVTLSVNVSDPDGDPMDVTFCNASDDSVIDTAGGVSSGGQASVTWSGLSEDTTYSWYAIANDSQAENRSSTWSFTTEDVNHAPDEPIDPSPMDGATGVSTSVTLSVNVSDPDGDIMDVTFCNASDDSVIETASGISSGGQASVTWSGLADGTTYEWYAIANDSQVETQSMTWSFTTEEPSSNSPPDPPANPNPEDGATGIGIEVTLSVDVSDPDGDTMDVTFYDASDESVIDTAPGVSDGGTASGTWSGLEHGQEYRWYVEVSDGAETVTSSTWSFNTSSSANNVPDAPIDPNPVDGADDVPTSPELSVNVSDPDGDTMDVTFYDASDGSEIQTVSNAADGERVSITWSGLEHGTTYDWYAVANDSDLETRSNTWSFTTMDEDNTSPEASIDVDSTTVQTGEEMTLDAGSSTDDVGVNNYTWIIDGEEFYGETVSYTFDEEGEYTVELTVSDLAGNADNSTVEITVEDEETGSGAEDTGLGMLPYILLIIVAVLIISGIAYWKLKGGTEEPMEEEPLDEEYVEEEEALEEEDSFEEDIDEFDSEEEIE